jgi:hypothetical protein
METIVLQSVGNRQGHRRELCQLVDGGRNLTDTHRLLGPVRAVAA